jgi:hypothetical protein
MSAASFVPRCVVRPRNKSAFRFQFLRAWLALSGLFDSYHPERHYMRGPGPKCREKNRRSG